MDNTQSITFTVAEHDAETAARGLHAQGFEADAAPRRLGERGRRVEVCFQAGQEAEVRSAMRVLAPGATEA